MKGFVGTPAPAFGEVDKEVWEGEFGASFPPEPVGGLLGNGMGMGMGYIQPPGSWLMAGC
jgi:hypothetical protein